MSTTLPPNTLDYEDRLKRDPEWAMDEGDRFFRGDDAVFRTMRRIARRLEELKVPYAIAGGMALNAHGHRRLTVDVDILVSRDGLKRVHEALDGLGYVPPFTGSKNLRDAEHGVRIEFLVSGDYPGDGRPKPVAFPDPAAEDVAEVVSGMSFLSLPRLVELKLASGMTGGVHRLKDLADVVAIIEARDLPRDLAHRLNPYVRDKFLELWDGVHTDPNQRAH